MPASRRTVLVGWDAADWGLIDQFIERGLMPHLAGLLERGVRGRLATLEPMLSPMLWNSIATGKTADGHGILGFVEPKPDGAGIRPVSSRSRRSKALWNILSQNGQRSLVFNWFASHPAEPIDGVCVTNRFPHPIGRGDQDWPLQAGTVHPPELAEPLRAQRVHPAELGPDAIAPFLRAWERVDSAGDKPLKELVGMLAQCLSVHAASTWAMEHTDWDLCAIYHDAIDHFGHVFMPYFPPRQEHVDERMFDAYHAVMPGIYQFHDMMLGRLIELAGEEATIIVCSDHGFHHDAARPTDTSNPVAWHKPLGMIAMAGPGVRRGGVVHGASLLDVAPTVLALHGLPAGEDMLGRVLDQAFEEPPQLGRIETWEEVDGDDGSHPPDAQDDPLADHEAVRQLVALGYVDAPDESVEKTIERVAFEMRRNLADSQRAMGRFADAAETLAALHADRPDDSGVKLRLAQCRLMAGDLEGCRTLVEGVMATWEGRPAADLLRGNLAMAGGDADAALAHYLKADQHRSALPGLRTQTAYCLLRLKRWDEALTTLRDVLEVEGDSVQALHGMCVALLGLRRPDEAIDYGLRSRRVRRHYPKAHFHLGQALALAGRAAEAAVAFTEVTRLLPKASAPRLALAELYEGPLADPVEAERHRREGELLRRRSSLRPLDV